MSLLDCAVPAGKAKLTLSVTKEMAVAYHCVLDLALAYAEAKLYSGSLRQCSGLTLVEESAGSTSSSIRSNSTCADVSKLALFNSSLHSFAHSNIYLVSLPGELRQLLDLYYEQSLAAADTMFPFLHGLSSAKQRVYFHDKFDAAADMDLLHGDTALVVARFPHNTDVNVPEGFHLMTVNSLEVERPMLANSVSVDDLLTYKPGAVCTHDDVNFDHSMFERFSHIYQLQESPGLELSNRNYDLQIKLMAPVSSFLVYNNGMDFFANLEAAKAISRLMPRGDRYVYVVDFDVSKWSQMGPYLASSTSYTVCDQVYEADPQDSLSGMEQNLIWLLNGLRELFPRLYVGNVFNFKQFVLSPRSSHHDFKLHVYCHENAKLPSLSALGKIFDQLHDGLDEPIHLEFPDSVFRHVQSLSYAETLSYLNVLKLINVVVNRFKRNAFVYSFDGFTGVTLLSFSLGLFWGTDNIEDVACSLLRKPAFNFYLMRGDFGFLKQFEMYVQWFKRQPLKDFALVVDIPVRAINTSYRPLSRTVDWFDPHSDVNFPSHIYDNVFLGSVEHASSFTVLSTLKIDKIISIDEKPSWYRCLPFVLEHEATPSSSNIIRPTYTFNNGSACLYEIPVTGAVAQKLLDIGAPQIKSLVFFYNIRDDGKDSILPLLVSCPEHIQRKFLVDPSDSSVRALLHCRIGVSRSASFVIASVMKYLNMDVVESYMYVRVRRFNVIIQPNLRIFYELFLYDEMLRKARHGDGVRAKYCWWVVCEQIARLNEQYIR